MNTHMTMKELATYMNSGGMPLLSAADCLGRDMTQAEVDEVEVHMEAGAFCPTIAAQWRAADCAGEPTSTFGE